MEHDDAAVDEREKMDDDDSDIDFDDGDGDDESNDLLQSLLAIEASELMSMI